MIADALRWAADRLERPKPHESPDYPLRCESVFTDEQANGRRREDAMRLVDEQTQGYVQLVVRDHGFHSAIEPAIEASPAMWPALRETMVRLILEGEREFGGE